MKLVSIFFKHIGRIFVIMKIDMQNQLNFQINVPI